MFETLEGPGGVLYEKRPYHMTIDWNDSDIAAGTTGSASTKNDSGFDFVVERMHLAIWNPDGSAPTIAGTPYARASDPSPPATVGNTWPTYAHFRMEMKIHDDSIFQSPVRATMFAEPFYPLTRLRIGAGQSVTGKLYNDTPAMDARAQLVLEGHRLVPVDQPRRVARRAA